MITLRVTGLGHTLTLEIESSTTVGDLKDCIQQHTHLPSEYQRILARGSKLEDNDCTLEDASIKDRTKIMLMHSALYIQEKEAFESLSKLSKEIDELAEKKASKSPDEIREDVTNICCRLDQVDVKGSENLRAKRKALLAAAESLDHLPTEVINDQRDEN